MSIIDNVSLAEILQDPATFSSAALRKITVEALAVAALLDKRNEFLKKDFGEKSLAINAKFALYRHNLSEGEDPSIEISLSFLNAQSYSENGELNAGHKNHKGAILLNPKEVLFTAPKATVNDNHPLATFLKNAGIKTIKDKKLVTAEKTLTKKKNALQEWLGGNERRGDCGKELHTRLSYQDGITNARQAVKTLTSNFTIAHTSNNPQKIIPATSAYLDMIISRMNVPSFENL